jgi:hypothetical protein
MRHPEIIVGLLFINLSVFSQKPDTAIYYFTGYQAQYGFIIPHTAEIEPVSHTNPFGFEISFNRLCTSYKSWKVYNRYNISGFQLSYFNYQNPEILGSAFVLTIFTEPIISFGERWLFSIKGGMGISYHTRVYDPDNNPLNEFFSTRVSFPLYLMARFKYRISRNLNFTLSGSYNHISNGAMHVPNYGMNFPTLLLGIEYFQKPLPRLNKVYTADHSRTSSQYLIIQTLTGYKVVYSEAEYTFGLHTRYTWQLRSHYALNAGAEIILDGGVKRMIEVEKKEVDYKRFAITAGQDFIFGKMSFTQYFGFYIYSPYEAKNMIYQKYELSYRFLPEFMAGVYLKAHSSEAELFGITFNYVLRYK